MTIMTPSVETISIGQIGKIHELLDSALRKSNIPREGTQKVLEDQGGALVDDFVSSLRKRAEAASEMIVRHFKIDRTKSKKEMIHSLGRREYVENDVLATMPIEGPDEGDLYFFPAKRFIPVNELAREFEIRGLTPHPLAQMQVNIDDPSFADDYPNGVQWQDSKKRFSYATFDRWGGGREVLVNSSGLDWDDRWWFGGVRKST
jgi:hypothetical protein